MHGKDTSPEEKWYPWFKDAVKKAGCEFETPVLPNAADPVMNEWLRELAECNPDKDTILVGHSRGGVAVMRYLEQMSDGDKVKAVVLVATNSGVLNDMAIPSESNYGFYTEEGYDFEKIKTHCDNFYVMHSTDDKWVPYTAGVQNAKGLDVELLSFANRGHFGKGVDEIPELLEIVESLK